MALVRKNPGQGTAQSEPFERSPVSQSSYIEGANRPSLMGMNGQIQVKAPQELLLEIPSESAVARPDRETVCSSSARVGGAGVSHKDKCSARRFAAGGAEVHKDFGSKEVARIGQVSRVRCHPIRLKLKAPDIWRFIRMTLWALSRLQARHIMRPHSQVSNRSASVRSAVPYITLLRSTETGESSTPGA